MWSTLVKKTIWNNLKSSTSACRSWYHSSACTPTIGPCLKSNQWGSKTSFSWIGLTWKSIWTATMVTSSKRSLGINALLNDPRIVPTSPVPAPASTHQHDDGKHHQQHQEEPHHHAMMIETITTTIIKSWCCWQMRTTPFLIIKHWSGQPGAGGGAGEYWRQWEQDHLAEVDVNHCTAARFWIAAFSGPATSRTGPIRQLPRSDTIETDCSYCEYYYSAPTVNTTTMN